MGRAIYLDGHATTPLAPEALEAMLPWWHDLAANPSSSHAGGALASQAVEMARQHIADLIGVISNEIVFTSGATEANNIALIGTAEAAIIDGSSRRKIVISSIEHKSVIEAAAALKVKGFDVCIIPVLPNGIVDVEAARKLIDRSTLIVSVMAVNNEVGTIQPVREISDLAHDVGAVFHTDAAQALGKTPFEAGNFDLVSLSSHKVYGPVGIGALFVSAASNIKPRPLFRGGGQERGLRPGTVPTPLAVGFGMAAQLAAGQIEADFQHSADISRRLLSELDALQVKYHLNAMSANRVPGSLNLRFPGFDAASLINKLGYRLYLSEGSACTSGQIEPSHVLTSMGLTWEEARESVRIYCGRYNTQEDAVAAARILAVALTN